MSPEELVYSIYVGDRACKAVLIEGWRKRLAIQVDMISRLKPNAKTWDYNTEGDIADGWIVFSGVQEVRFDPSGPLPNDFINNIRVTRLENLGSTKLFQFEVSVGSVDAGGDTTEVTLTVRAAGVHIEDPAKPGLEIST